jgi:hypothetical protein
LFCPHTSRRSPYHRHATGPEAGSVTHDRCGAAAWRPPGARCRAFPRDAPGNVERRDLAQEPNRNARLFRKKSSKEASAHRRRMAVPHKLGHTERKTNIVPDGNHGSMDSGQLRCGEPRLSCRAGSELHDGTSLLRMRFSRRCGTDCTRRAVDARRVWPDSSLPWPQQRLRPG